MSVDPSSVAAQIPALTSISETARNELTNLLFLTVLQIEPVQWLCNGESGNAMTVPEWGTTVINFGSFFLAMAGVFLVLFVGVLGWGMEKVSKTTGGGGGKMVIALGLACLVLAGVVYTIPDFADQAYEGAGQCFAMIRPAVGF